jgi:alkylated DNA repair dioxygenase AlkB
MGESAKPAATNISLQDGKLRHWPSFVAADYGDRLLAELQTSLHWERHVVRIFGREVPSPRLSAWYGDPACEYRYSGLRLSPLPWTGPLSEIRELVQDATRCPFNCVLANLYRDGNDSMGWHSDDEPELGRDPNIASLSLGAERRFLLRHKHRTELPRIEVLLGHGDLLLMSGPTQRFWKHQVPKSRRVGQARLNLTFRLIPGDAPRR